MSVYDLSRTPRSIDKHPGCLVYLAHKSPHSRRALEIMAVNVAEYVNKMQQDSLAAIKQGQDAGIKALEQFRSLGKEFADNPGSFPTFENIPSPTQFVEMSFSFAAQLLELRKSYTLKIAEMLVETQKQAEATVKQATASVQSVQNGSPVSAKSATAAK